MEHDISRWRDTLAWMLSRTTFLKVSDENLRPLCPGQEPAALTCSRRGADLPRRKELPQP